METLTDVDLGLEGFEATVEIGRGGFGVVYKAWEPALSRWVAIKVLSVAVFDDAARVRFTRELQTAARVSGHPNIVTVYGTGFDRNGRPCIVMEWMARGALMRAGRSAPPLAWQRAVEIGVKLCGALDTVHRVGVVHGDVKPENILVSAFDEPALGDFGASAAQNLGTTERVNLHATVAHAAPELLSGAAPTSLVDVYALASSLMTLLRGQVPFATGPGDTTVAILERIRSAPPPDLRPLGTPEGVNAVLQRAMSKDPAQRPQSAGEFGEELRAAQQAAGMTPTQMVVSTVPVEGSAGPTQTAVLPRRAPQVVTTFTEPVGDATRVIDASPKVKRRLSALAIAGIIVGVLALAGGGTAGYLALRNAGQPSPGPGPSGSSVPTPTGSVQSSGGQSASPSATTAATPTPTPSSTAPPTPIPSTASLQAVLPDQSIVSGLDGFPYVQEEDQNLTAGLLGGYSGLNLCGGSVVSEQPSENVHRIFTGYAGNSILGVEVTAFAVPGAASDYFSTVQSIARICEGQPNQGSTAQAGLTVSQRPCNYAGQQSLCLNMGNSADFVLVQNGPCVLELYYNDASDGAHSAHVDSWASTLAGKLQQAVATAH